jgi:hypothetical protein
MDGGIQREIRLLPTVSAARSWQRNVIEARWVHSNDHAPCMVARKEDPQVMSSTGPPALRDPLSVAPRCRDLAEKPAYASLLITCRRSACVAECGMYSCSLR